jgi:subtilisin family serine protease
MNPSTMSLVPTRVLLAAALALCWSARSLADAAPGEVPAKKAIEKADDLPRHTYLVSKAPSLILKDPAAFWDLEKAVKKDMLADLETYDIRDRSTVQGFKSTLLSMALLEGDYALGHKLVDELRALEEKPSKKATTALVTAAWIRTQQTGGPGPDFGARFQAELDGTVKPLDWSLVQNDIKSAKAGYEIRSESLLIGILQKEVDPAAVKTGSISADVARQIVGMRNQIVNFLPYKGQIVAALDGYISAHRVVKPDRWTPRLVELDPSEHAQPIVVAVWDSGVDVDIFKDRLVTDAEGRHGRAFDLHSNPVPDIIFPIADLVPNVSHLVGRLKGFLDLQASIDSPDSAEVKKFMGELKPEQVSPTLEGLNITGNWAHGTHVAGISLAGNPFARLLVGRITYDYHLVHETPTIEQAKKDSAAYLSMVDYFKRNGVRVVNMSWGGSLKDVENDLEENGAGGNAEERKALARKIFDIGRDGLLEALKGAPQILFVVAAGNSDNNVKFDEFIPSSFQIPNMITVGAVDQAGEETSFSSFGPMVNVHANGFEVESYIPGGQRLKLSGTSMASPQVTNLAAKLFALDAALTPEEAKQLIIDGCEKTGRVNLISPKASVALLKQKLTQAGK